MLMNIWNKVVNDKKTDKGDDIAHFFMACRGGYNPPLYEMVKSVFKEIEDALGPTNMRPLELACRAAEKPNRNPYHNEDHNREVTLLTSMLLLKHIKDGNKAGFKARDARNLIMAAAVHDLDHDGGSNKVDGVYIPMRLEINSMNSASNLWKDEDVNKNDYSFMGACIVATDVSKPADGISQRDKLVESFNGASAKPSVYNNKMWRTAAAILSDADLAISGALSPEMFAVNSIQLEKETKGAVPANPSSAKYFLNNVLTSFPLSSEGGILLQSGYNKIKAAVMGA